MVNINVLWRGKPKCLSVAKPKGSNVTNDLDESCVTHSYFQTVITDFYYDMNSVLKRVEYLEDTIAKLENDFELCRN